MSSVISSIHNSVRNVATDSVNFVGGKINDAQRTFEYVTERVIPSTTVARIVQMMVYSSPFAAAWIFLPMQVNVAALVVYGIAHVLNEAATEENARLLPDSVYRNFFFGTGAVLIVATAAEAAKVLAGQKASIVLAIAEFALGALSIRHSNAYAPKEQQVDVVTGT